MEFGVNKVCNATMFRHQCPEQPQALLMRDGQGVRKATFLDLLLLFFFPAHLPFFFSVGLPGTRHGGPRKPRNVNLNPLLKALTCLLVPSCKMTSVLLFIDKWSLCALIGGTKCYSDPLWSGPIRILSISICYLLPESNNVLYMSK